MNEALLKTFKMYLRNIPLTHVDVAQVKMKCLCLVSCCTPFTEM